MKLYPFASLSLILTGTLSVLPCLARAARLNLGPNETGQAWVDQARKAEGSQDFERAEFLYQRASILPGSEEAGTVGLAHLQASEGDLEKASQTLRIFVKQVNPFSLDAHLALVDIYLAMNQQPQAETELAIVSKLRPGYAPANERIGVISFRNGKYHQAVAVLSKVLERNPNQMNALELRARSYMRLEKYSSALADYKQLQALDPDQIENYVAIGKIYIQLEEYDVAEKYISAALGASEVSASKRVQIFELAGQLEQLRGNSKKAVVYFKKAFDVNPADFDLGYKLSDLYVTARNFPLAQQTLAKIMAASPGNEAAARRMVELYTLLGRRDGLGVFLRNYVEAFPDKIWAAIAYSKILNEIGDASGAESVLKTASKDAELSADIALALAKANAQQGKLAEAQSILSKGTENFPKDDRLHFDLGLCWEKLQQPEKAMTEYLRVSKTNPELFQKAVINLAQIYENAGDKAKAYAALKLIEPKGPLASAVQAKIEELSQGRSPASEK